MSISPTQITEARRLLRRGSTWLARVAQVDYSTVISVQQGREVADPSIMVAIRRVLEAHGVDFTAEDDGRAAVRLREPSAA